MNFQSQGKGKKAQPWLRADISDEKVLLAHGNREYNIWRNQLWDSRGIKLAAFDLDDTLLLPEGTLSERARAAIEKAADLGMEIVLASGRSFSSLPAELLGMPQIHYAITSNGAAVNEVPSGKRILARCLSLKAYG